MDSKHPYTSHFPSSNKGSWQDNQAQLPSNTQYKQINPIIENPIKSTTPPCDVRIFTFNYIIIHSLIIC